ncbi:unnamed protein product [Coffea canephora]|uniref:Uncharacterized protein n=1 Tax=Coffea canephora TaxID=49390 RepID=A0A068UFU8_COFCA|nr:unnamed protein product [Coffea canephora]
MTFYFHSLGGGGFFFWVRSVFSLLICKEVFFWSVSLAIPIDTSSRISKIRSRKRERLHGPPWLKAVQGALLSSMYAVLDYAQTGLIATMMEGWYQSAEERMSAPTVYPPPPPSPPPKVAKEGIPLPPDRMLCPLRSQKCVNPSAVAVSGFVFCYSCIFK